MDPERSRRSPARKWWLLVGGIVVFVVAFDLLERLVGPSPSASETAPAARGTASPAPPEVRRLEDGAIEIRHDFFRRSTIRLGDEDEQQVLFDCLRQGIERRFGEGTEGWSRERVRRETQEIQDACLGAVHDFPLPIPPSRG